MFSRVAVLAVELLYATPQASKSSKIYRKQQNLSIWCVSKQLSRSKTIILWTDDSFGSHATQSFPFSFYLYMDCAADGTNHDKQHIQYRTTGCP